MIINFMYVVNYYTGYFLYHNYVMRYYKSNIKSAGCTHKMPGIYAKFEHFLHFECTDSGL